MQDYENACYDAEQGIIRSCLSSDMSTLPMPIRRFAIRLAELRTKLNGLREEPS